MNHLTPAEERLAAQLAAAPACDVAWGSAAASQRCTLAPRHPLPHVDSTGHEWGWGPSMTERATACQPRDERGAPPVLARIHVHTFGQDGICIVCDLDIVTWSREGDILEFGRIAIEGTRS